MLDKFPCLRIKTRRSDGGSIDIEIRPSLIRWLLIVLIVVVLLFQGADPGHLLRDFLHLPEANGPSNQAMRGPHARLLPGEFRGFSMLTDLGIIHDEARTKLKFSVVLMEWLVVEPADDLLFLVVADLDANPHPLSDTRSFIGKFDFDVIARFVGCHLALANSAFGPRFKPKAINRTVSRHP